MNFRELFAGADLPTRRQFLGGAGRSLLGVGAMPLLAQLASGAEHGPGALPRVGRGTARNVIYLFMSGGMSHLDTFDLKPGAETQGPTEAIPTNVDGIVLSQHFRNLARLTDRVALVNSLHTNQGAHAEGRYFMHTSYEMRGTIKHPSLGAWLLRFQGKENPALPGHVAVGNRWYGWLCERQSLEPVAHYRALVRQYGAPRLKGPFNTAARQQAGFSAEELAALTEPAAS